MTASESSPAYVLKEGRWFACFGAEGSIGAGMDGLYLGDVRLIGHYDHRFAGRDLALVDADTSESHHLRLEYEGEGVVLSVARWLVREGFVETLLFANDSGRRREGRLEIRIGFDFGDVVEARGILEPWTREVDVEHATGSTLFAHYRGPDGFQAALLLSATSDFDWDEDSTLGFDVSLGPGEALALELTIGGLVGEGTLAAPAASAGRVELEESVQSWRDSLPEIETDDEATNAVLSRSTEDLRLLWTWTGRESGFFAAGIPHFVAPFGRDGLITSFELLPLLPEQARWTLAELARHQGRKLHHPSEEEPGKIPHEIRSGERSRPDDYPYAYASIDATLLFPVLLDEYLSWSGDLDFVREMEPVLRGILDWCADHGDTNGDGFIDYADWKRGELGLAHRGWKDGEPGAVSMGDGSAPAYPVAMVEFQGYARDALRACARMFSILGDGEIVARCETVATELKRVFDAAFWWPEEACLAMGLDGRGRRIDCVGTNQGHCLMSDLVEPDRREALVARLMRADSFSGFGLRTLATGTADYSPHRYQRGAVWPHDNALVAYGMHRRGFRREGNRVAAGILRAAAKLPDQRLPELFAGLSAEESGGEPVALDMACKPQAWAAASPFLFLRACLGIFPDALERKVVLSPFLEGLPFTEVRVRNLRVAGGDLSFDARFVEGRTELVPLGKTGDFRVEIVS